MFYRIAKSFGFGIFLGILINFIERYKAYDNLTIFVGLITLALGLLLMNISSNMNYSLTLPDSHWTNFKSKIKDKNDKVKLSYLIIVGISIIAVGLIF